MCVLLFSSVIAFFSLGSAHGHSGDRVYPFYEITDEAAIDITDGSIEDWEELFGEPSLTSLDFTAFEDQARIRMDYDPSDLDFRIYLGWNGDTDRIYVGAICIDDVYIGEEEMSLKYLPRGGEDHLAIEIDGDHDGASAWDESFTHIRGNIGDDSKLLNQSAQFYNAVPLRNETSHVGLPYFESIFEGEESWWGYPPYGDGGGSVAGENPVVWITEFFVTPFDWLLRREPENSLVSDLASGGIVGFRVFVGDFDEPAINGPGGNRAAEDHVIGIYDVVDLRDIPDGGWMDGILLPTNGIDPGDSAVKPDSWARIKASFSP